MIRVALLASALYAPASTFACDIALQLSFDVSLSVKDPDFRRMAEGTAAAMLDPEVLESFTERGEVWLQIVAWADKQVILLDWTEMADRAAVENAAGLLAAAPRPTMAGSQTGTGLAMLFAQAQFDRGPLCDKLVVDIAGDGESNHGPHPQGVHAALDPALQINALATNTGATSFYETFVIQGPAAFVEAADGYENFTEAMKKKLSMELFLG